LLIRGNGRHRRRSERGQTIILVAISLISLLAMAALAIDVVTLYVARSEIERAADAAALAGAKAMADSGITTLSTADLTLNEPTIQTLAQSMATSAINAVLPNNLVAGSTPTQVAGSPSFLPNLGAIPTTPANSWQVTVSLQRTGLPTFFAHIWGTTAASVSASATAEAYNPANMTSFTRISLTNVKPWFVANRDPTHGSNTKFVDPVTGAVEARVITDPAFMLQSDCSGTANPCSLSVIPPGAVSGPPVAVQYVPALVTANPANVCPASSGACRTGSDYENSIQCADMNPYPCGGSGTNAQWDTTGSVNPNIGSTASADTTDGVECLIHATGTGPGPPQDSLDLSSWPSAPPEIHSASGSTLVSTSSSIVTIPIIDVDTPGAFSTSGPVTVIGYLQGFIQQIDANNNIQINVMNVVGCSQTPNAANPVTGVTGASTIPVRLITSP
jgi:Flp pilus assembly protein TadG